jgi:hypothetical protein
MQRMRLAVSILELQHYTIRFRESERLRYRLPRMIWRFLIRTSGSRRTPI